MTIAYTATNRDSSLFDADVENAQGRIRDAVKGARILAVGAAGSIGSQTIKVLARYNPAALHVIDQNENALAELVRQLRSAPEPFEVDDFQTLPLDYGAPVTHSFLAANKPYDRVLNFAAIKHVRSEKDPFSISQMLNTNVVKQARFGDWVAKYSPEADYFSVSTDKAANPASFMGATKRIMEHVLFDRAKDIGMKGAVTSARFANVAYSNGSLLQSFENRLARREPLACPKGIKRYFVSLEESGQICTLASIAVPDQHIAIPRLDPESNLVSLQWVAERFLEANNLEAEFFDDEAEARLRAQDPAQGKWPLLLTSANTAGEKSYEEFVAVNETRREIGLENILCVPYVGPAGNERTQSVVDLLEGVIDNVDNSFTKDEFKEQIARLEPGFLKSHLESSENLDQRA